MENLSKVDLDKKKEEGLSYSGKDADQLYKRERTDF